jgi:flagellar motor switch protein FliM
MSKILSQDEIDALLSTAPAGDAGTALYPTGGSAVTYNFRRPDRISKEQIRSLHFLHDRFARNFASSLAAFLRMVTEVSIVSVEQFSYSEFLMSLSDPTAYYALSIAPLEGLCALELNPTIAFTMVARMLGGSGNSVPPRRALTEIEQNVIDSVVKLLLEHLAETWRTVFDLQFRIQGRETRPQMLQVAGQNEAVIRLAFDVKVGDIRGMLNLCMPSGIIEATGTAFTQGWQRTHREPSPTERAWLEATLGRVPLRVTTTLETRLRARDLVKLEPGDVLSLDIPASAPINVCVENQIKFMGRLASIEGRRSAIVERTLHTEPRIPGGA